MFVVTLRGFMFIFDHESWTKGIFDDFHVFLSVWKQDREAQLAT